MRDESDTINIFDGIIRVCLHVVGGGGKNIEEQIEGKRKYAVLHATIQFRKCMAISPRREY